MIEISFGSGSTSAAGIRRGRPGPPRVDTIAGLGVETVPGAKDQQFGVAFRAGCPGAV
jgi:hypothetical protein